MSNPDAGDLQDLILATGESLHIHIASLAQAWNTQNNIGLVVGATYPETLARVRLAAPDLWFLVPGVGTQGGDLETALQAGLQKDGKGALINVSRSISRSPDPRKAAAELRDKMLGVHPSGTGAHRIVPGSRFTISALSAPRPFSREKSRTISLGLKY